MAHHTVMRQMIADENDMTQIIVGIEKASRVQIVMKRYVRLKCSRLLYRYHADNKRDESSERVIVLIITIVAIRSEEGRRSVDDPHRYGCTLIAVNPIQPIIHPAVFREIKRARKWGTY